MGAEGVVGVHQRWQLSGRLRAARVAEPTREYQVDALRALGCPELEVRAAVHRDVQGAFQALARFSASRMLATWRALIPTDVVTAATPGRG